MGPLFYGVASNEFMENLKRLMDERHLTISELARRSGVSYQQISYYLTGDQRGKLPTMKNLVKLAQGLRCDLEELTGLRDLKGKTEIPPPPDPEAQALWDIYTSLPDGDTLKELLKQKIQERKKRAQESEGRDS